MGNVSPGTSITVREFNPFEGSDVLSNIDWVPPIQSSNDYIDIICFGRTGTGKTTLLEAITGKNLGSSFVENTETMFCVEHHFIMESNIKHVRFWAIKCLEEALTQSLLLGYTWYR